MKPLQSTALILKERNISEAADILAKPANEKFLDALIDDLTVQDSVTNFLNREDISLAEEGWSLFPTGYKVPFTLCHG